MIPLGTERAAKIANDVYAIRDNSIEKAMKLSGGDLGMNGEFKIASSGRFDGTSGPLFFKTRTGFGYIAEGQGRRQGEVLIATRGTVPGIQDIGTDLNIGLQIGPSGWPVHAGFNDTFKSFKKTIQQYFIRKNPCHIHCVGHSLGGALATLIADYVTEHRIASASLYTFGSPRVGAMGFSSNFTQKLGTENIYRAYHNADPISMIPLFPFFHVPASTSDIMLNWSGGKVSPAAHGMENYMRSVSGTNWGALRNGSQKIDWSTQAKQWLESSVSEGLFMFGAKTLWMITKALGWIIKKILIVGVGTALTITATVIDQLAWLLYNGALAVVKIYDYLKSLLSRMLSFMGRAVIATSNVTVAFIRWVLSSFYSCLTNIASRSLSLING